MKRMALVNLALLIIFSAKSQNPSKLINGLFTEWTNKNTPGGVVMVAHKNTTVYSKAFGLANISYQIPNTQATVFNIGSVAKQFTAMGIVLLQLEGKLSFDDAIHTYLPELHNFTPPITIRQLLHHTSGIRSVPELLGLAGWRDGDAFSNEDVYRYLQKQHDLNFEPNSEYMYTNSGYILLAKIIENVSKKKFKSFMEERIFQPFQMNATFIEEDYSKIMSQIASSYTQIAASVFQTVENTDLTYGASNVYSTCGDLLKWSKNYHEAPNEWQKAFKLLETLTDLNSGKKNNYGFGIFVDNYWGNRRIQHTGGIAGFQSVMYCYPDDDVQIVILSNYSSIQLSKIADLISQLFLQQKSITATIEEVVNTLKLSSDSMRKFEGMYWNDKTNLIRKVYVENDTLWYMRNNNRKSPLYPISDIAFQMGGINEKLYVHFEVKSATMLLISADNSVDTFEKYEDKPLSQEELLSYTGYFYSDELETSYTISLKDGALYGYHSRFGEFEVQVLKKDVHSWSGTAVSKYKRNESGTITGISVTLSRIRNVWFDKK
jgi:CubicO group peptidase (beta-lactamase class C family)